MLIDNSDKNPPRRIGSSAASPGIVVALPRNFHLRTRALTGTVAPIHNYRQRTKGMIEWGGT